MTEDVATTEGTALPRGTPSSWLVVLADREHARLLHFDAASLTELDAWSDEAPPRVDVGIWSGPRIERHADEVAHRHLSAVARAVADHAGNGPVRVLVGGPDRAASELARLLEDAAAKGGPVVAGRFSAAVLAPQAELLSRLDAVTAALEAEAEDAFLGGLADRTLTVGLDDVAGSLADRRVRLVVLERSFSGLVACCLSCGFAVASGPAAPETCPRCRAELAPPVDATGWVVERAESQRAEVRFVAPDALAAYGAIVAEERF